jgi:hypothetical protein
MADTESTKPYSCSVCGRKFGRGEHLRRHSSAHANVKPFQCKFCEKRFARKYTWSKNLKADDVGMFCIDIIIVVKLRERKHRCQRSRRGERVIGVKDSSRVALAESLAKDVNRVLTYVL